MPTVPRIDISTERVSGGPGAFINPQGNISRAFGEGVGEAQSRVGEGIIRAGAGQIQAGHGMESMGAGVGRMGEGLIAKGAGEAKIGGALEQVGDTLAKHAMNLQDRHNQALATDMFVQWDKEVSMEGAKFRTLQGMQAVEALPGYMSKIEEIRNRWGSTAPNVEVKRLFDLDSKRRAGYMITDGAYYAGNQNKQYNIAASNARQVQAIANAGNAKDDEEFKNEVVSALRGVNAEAVERGWSEDVAKVERMKAVSKAWGQRLDTIAMTDPFRAQALYEQNKDQILDPATRMHIEKNLIQQYNAVGTRYDADSIANGVPFRSFPTTGGKAEEVNQFFIKKGLSKEAAAAITGHLLHESGLDPTRSHDSGTGIGVAGWRLERRAALEAFARDRGKPVTDLETQLEFVAHEGEYGDEGAKRAWKELKSAKTVEEAVTAFMHFERPAGYTPGTPQSGHGYQSRIAQARRVAGIEAEPLTPDSGPEWLRGAIDRAKLIAQARAPNNPAYEDLLISRVKNEYNNVKTMKSAVDQANYFTMVGALMKVDEAGKPAITNMSQIMDDPQLNNAFNALPPPRQKAVMAQVERNAKADVPLDDPRLQRFNEIMGMKTTAPEQFREIDPMVEDLPRSMKNQIFAAQRAQQKNQISDPGFQRALHSVQGLLNDADIGQSAADKTKNARYNQFVGAFQAKREEWFKEKGKYPEIEDNRKIAAQLLTDTERPGRFWGTNTMPQFEVPANEVEKIKEAYRTKQGRNPTDREVYDTYQRKLNSGK